MSVTATSVSGRRMFQNASHTGFDVAAAAAGSDAPRDSASTGAERNPPKMCNAADMLIPTQAITLELTPMTANPVVGPAINRLRSLVGMYCVLRISGDCSNDS